MASLNYPADLKYSATDEWVRVEGDQATIGITDYAQDQLGDIVYIELPWDAAQTVAHEAKFGDIESVKATSDLYTGVSGTITAVNADLTNNPGLVNKDPYKAGWMVKIKVTDPGQVAKLLSSEDYLKKTGH